MMKTFVVQIQTVLKRNSDFGGWINQFFLTSYISTDCKLQHVKNSFKFFR